MSEESKSQSEDEDVIDTRKVNESENKGNDKSETKTKDNKSNS